MELRALGRSELEVPAVCFGAWALGGTAWGGSDDQLGAAAIRAGIEAGLTAVDTAPIYGFGRSERVLGEVLKDPGLRARTTVLTKAGLRWDDDRGQAFFDSEFEGRKVTVYRNARPDSLRFEVEASLRRLGVECLDLVQIHWPDPTTPIADSMGALAQLRSEGKLRAIGVSNYTPAMMEEARAALGDVPLASVQPKYNLLHREIEADVLPYAREHGVGTLVYSPLERGLLTGKVSLLRRFPSGDQRRSLREFSLFSRRRVLAALRSTVEPIAAQHGATVGQVVIAWTAAQPGVTGVLVGARDPEQARENAGAGRLRLGEDECRRISDAFPSPVRTERT